MSKPIIAITAGDINGIGYEIIIKALSNPMLCELCRPIVYGNAAIAKQHAQTLDEEYHNLQFHLITDAKQVKDGKINLITCYPDTTPVALGQATKEAGEAAFKSLQRACADIQQGVVDAIVTAPINKDSIQSPEWSYTGHTEYFSHYFATQEESVMMLISDSMRIALACNHTPIAQVAQTITQERIVNKLRVLNHSLQHDFRIRKPRIAVLALNPHAGDNGLIGSEEQTIILPAVQQAEQEGMSVFGPWAADGFFGAKEYYRYDAVLAMYHDQGLAPFKSLDMSGVNFTAGLRIVRTSPDHGTAYDKAGHNQASAESMLHAIYTAIDIARLREEESHYPTPLSFSVKTN